MDRPSSLFTSNLGRQSNQNIASTAPIIGTTSVQLLYLFLAFQLVDQIFLPILIATFLLSETVKRHPTVVNVCVTWIITGIISSLLWYAGKHVGPEPPKLLCVSQASLLDGVLPMNSISVLALMFHVNLSIRKPKAQPNRIRIYGLLIAPYITFFCFSTSTAILAVQKPENVTRERRFFYCSLASPMSNALAIFSAIALIVALGYAASLGIFIRKNWRPFRQAGTVDIQFLSRIVGFVLYVFLSLLLSILSIFAPRNPFPDLFVASAGTALLLFLSTQRDVWRAWLPRSKSPPSAASDTSMTSVTEVPNTNERDFHFKNGGSSRAHHLDMENMGAPEADDMNLNDKMNVMKGLSDKGNASAVHHTLIGYIYDFRAGRDVPAHQGVNVPPYRFARPGMI